MTRMEQKECIHNYVTDVIEEEFYELDHFNNNVELGLSDPLLTDFDAGNSDFKTAIITKGIPNNNWDIKLHVRSLNPINTKELVGVYRFRKRVASIKKRVLRQLKLTDEEWNAADIKITQRRSLRQRKRACETPEQATARKREQAKKKTMYRHRIKAVETPQEKLTRLEMQREYHKKRCDIKESNESSLEHEQRKEKRKLYQERYKQRKLEKFATQQTEMKNI